jgi:hypothetical protein
LLDALGRANVLPKSSGSIEPNSEITAITAIPRDFGDAGD